MEAAAAETSYCEMVSGPWQTQGKEFTDGEGAGKKAHLPGLNNYEDRRADPEKQSAWKQDEIGSQEFAPHQVNVQRSRNSTPRELQSGDSLSSSLPLSVCRSSALVLMDRGPGRIPHPESTPETKKRLMFYKHRWPGVAWSHYSVSS